MDLGLQDSTTDLNLGEPRKSLVSGNVKCLRLQTQDRKNQISNISLCSATF